MWRNILAVVSGVLLAALGIGALRGITVFLLRQAASSSSDGLVLSYQLLKVAYTLASAIAGGYLAAAVAAKRTLRWHSAAVAILLAAALAAAHDRYTLQPKWYFNALLIATAFGPLLGGIWERRHDNLSSLQEARIYRFAKALVGGFLLVSAAVQYWRPSSDLSVIDPVAGTDSARLTATLIASLSGACLAYSAFAIKGQARDAKE